MRFSASRNYLTIPRGELIDEIEKLRAQLASAKYWEGRSQQTAEDNEKLRAKVELLRQELARVRQAFLELWRDD